MRHVFRLVVIALVVMALGGCFLFFPPVLDFTGWALGVNPDGHFRDDIIYKSGTTTWAFYSDGTYEYTYEEYEGTGEDWDGDGNIGEGWVVTSGSRYNYTADPDAYTLETDYTHFYDGTQWQPGTIDITRVQNAYFAQNKFYMGEQVMVRDDEADSRNTFVFSYSEDDNGDVYNETMTFTWDPDDMTWTVFVHSESFDSAGTKTDEDEVEINGSYTTVPEGERLVRGNTVTIRAVQEEYRERDWDPVSGWGSWSVNADDSVEVMVLSHMGDFLLEDGEMSYRGLVPEME